MWLFLGRAKSGFFSGGNREGVTCWHDGGGRSNCGDGGGWHANGVRHGGGGDGSSSGQQQQWHAVGTACARVWARQGEGVPAAAQGVFSGGRQGWAAVGRKGGEVLVESGSGAAWRYAGCLLRLSRGLIRCDSPAEVVQDRAAGTEARRAQTDPGAEGNEQGTPARGNENDNDGKAKAKVRRTAT